MKLGGGVSYSDNPVTDQIAKSRPLESLAYTGLSRMRAECHPALRVMALMSNRVQYAREAIDDFIEAPEDKPEISIVFPCLNERDTVAASVREALRVLEENGIYGEVIVADNGSTDGSQEIA